MDKIPPLWTYIYILHKKPLIVKVFLIIVTPKSQVFEYFFNIINIYIQYLTAETIKKVYRVKILKGFSPDRPVKTRRTVWTRIEKPCIARWCPIQNFTAPNVLCYLSRQVNRGITREVCKPFWLSYIGLRFLIVGFLNPFITRQAGSYFSKKKSKPKSFIDKLKTF